MIVWVFAIRQRPKVFLQAGRYASLGQWRLVYLPFVDRSHDWVQPEAGGGHRQEYPRIQSVALVLTATRPRGIAEGQPPWRFFYLSESGG